MTSETTKINEPKMTKLYTLSALVCIVNFFVGVFGGLIISGFEGLTFMMVLLVITIPFGIYCNVQEEKCKKYLINLESQYFYNLREESK